MADRILVADTDEETQETCRRILTESGYEAISAFSREEAIRFMESGHFAAVLIDLTASERSGLELIDLVQGLNPDCTRVAMSGRPDIQSAVEAIKKGACEYLTKPLTADTLLTAVQKALKERRIARKAEDLQKKQGDSLPESADKRIPPEVILQHIQYGILAVNSRQELGFINPAALKLLDLPENSPLNVPISKILPNPELVTKIQRFIGSHKSIWTSEITYKDLTLLAEGIKVRDSSGAIKGSIIVLQDITQWKTQKHAQTQFISVAAHELRAPIAAIEGYLEIVLTHAAGEDPKQERMMLERCRSRAEELLELIRDLLDVSRAEARKDRWPFDMVNLTRLLQEILTLLEPGILKMQITVENKIPSDFPAIEADNEEIERLFTNLLSNAIKYNRPSGKITLSGKTGSKSIQISIADTGIGIPEEALPHIFEEFYRVKSAETRRIKGTGLGLNLVKKIAEAHQGRVDVKSRVGEGSQFTVHLPLSQKKYP